MSSHLICMSLLLTKSVPVVDSVRVSLESTSDKWFIRLLISTAVVAIGCILEIGETWTDLRRWIRLKGGLPVAEENPTSWHVPAGAIGLMLVILGVIGEGIFEAYVSTSDTALRLHDEQILAETQTKAAEIYERAAGAMREAESAKLDAEEAKLRAQGASDKTDLETKKREQLGTEVGWRKLTPAQQEEIGKACKGTLDDVVSVTSYGMNPEAKALSVQVANAVFNHTFPVNLDTSGIVTSAALDEGVLISAPVEKIDFARCLANSLTVIGRLKSVTVNGARHRDGAAMGGSAVMSGNVVMGGGGGARTIVIPPAGSPISIFIGIKPTEPMPIKQ